MSGERPCHQKIGTNNHDLRNDLLPGKGSVLGGIVALAVSAMIFFQIFPYRKFKAEKEMYSKGVFSLGVLLISSSIALGVLGLVVKLLGSVLGFLSGILF